MSAIRKRISLLADDYAFIVSYDPERERSASRRDLIAVLEHIQESVAAGARHEQRRAEPDGTRRHSLARALHPDDIARWEERFHQRVPAADPGECWLWPGTLDTNGYGIYWIRDGKKKKKLRVHRMAWVYSDGRSIPEGMTIDHLCRIKNCVNPEHLEMVTHAENIHRRPLRKHEYGGNPANARTCPDCGSSFHRTYIAHHVCRESTDT